MDPAPVSVSARWPASRRLTTDLALGGAAVGTAIGYALLGTVGIAGAIIGGLVGALVGAVAGPRRLRLTLDADGVTIDRLTTTIRIPWVDVAAFGIEDGWQGRRGLTAALAVVRRGDDWPTEVPALSYQASGFRVGGTPPHEQLAPYRSELLAPIRGWKRARAITIVESDLADWWDRNRDSFRSD